MKRLVAVLFILTLIVIFISRTTLTQAVSYIDFRTLSTLFILLLITSSIKESYVVQNEIASRIHLIKTERGLALFLTMSTLLISMFLTNDVALFITLPILINVQSIIKNDMSKLLTLEAIAVNVGSSLTPIGNPQNIYLYTLSSFSFFKFVYTMLPMFLVSSLILIVFVVYLFKDSRLKFGNIVIYNENKTVFYLSLILLLMYIFFLPHTFIVLLLFVLFYLFFDPRSLLKVNYLLLITFSFLFVDFSIFERFVVVSSSILNNSALLYSFLVFLSQVISNVPASILISKYSHSWKAILYGVNVGGNGFISSSFANLIALSYNNKKFKEFHKYSVTFLIISFVSVLFLIELY